MPLHADILTYARQAGFDALTPIFWWKRTNMTTEISGDTYFLGKPYEPNGIIKSEIEYILLLRKPGGYRKPTDEQRRLSRIPKEDYHTWYRAVWADIGGASSPKHPGAVPGRVGEPSGAHVLFRVRHGAGSVRWIRYHLCRRGLGRTRLGRVLHRTRLPGLAENRLRAAAPNPAATVTRIVDPGNGAGGGF